MSRLIETDADVAEGLAALVAGDPRLGPLVAAAGAIPLRRRPGGFAGLAWIVVGQQVSTASADAIWGRLAGATDGVKPERVAQAGDATLRGAGLSAAKARSLRSLAEAVLGGFDLDGLATLGAEEAHAALVALPGVGPWTADIYLLSCLGHPDVFPAGDLALRAALAMGLQLDVRPDIAAAAAIATAWRPWRAVAARLFWAYYRKRRRS